MLPGKQIKIKTEKDTVAKKEQEAGQTNGVDSKPGVDGVAEAAEDEEDEDEDEEARWEEHIGWREVAGFISMCVAMAYAAAYVGIILIDSHTVQASTLRRESLQSYRPVPVSCLPE